MNGNMVATVIRTTYSKQTPQLKSLTYLREDSSETEKLLIPRSACVTKGNIIEFIDGEEVYVHCKHGDEKVQILPSYLEKDEVQLGDLKIPVSVKEITEPEEYEAYRQLQFHHYRGKSLFGRHAPLVMCTAHPLLPSVIGYIELATPFLVSKPRHEFFNTACQLNGIGWEQWNSETSRKYISLFVRIARCVVHPELRGAGIGQTLVKHSVQFAKEHWQSGGRQPYVLEICADMLRYVPFAENAGMIYIGETEGNKNRIAKDFSYFIRHLERFENKEILPDDSCGIVDVKRSQFQALLDSDLSKTSQQALTDLKKQIRNPTLKGEAKFKSVLVFPKPVYVKGLHPDAENFINDRIAELKLLSNMSNKKISFKAIEPIQSSIEIKDVEVKFIKQIPRTKLTNQVERAFGTSLDTFEHTILKSLNFSINPESICLVTGMSGTGKSTILQLLNKKIQPTSGNLEIPQEAKIGTLSPIRSKRPLIDFLGKGNMNRGIELMNSVGLSEAFLYVKPFQELSTGQKYRAMLASLFSTSNNLWLIDEFCESLDPITAKLVAKKLSTVARECKATVVICSADYEPFLETLCPDQVLLLQGATRYKVLTFDEFQRLV